jgi:hypothetical protein
LVGSIYRRLGRKGVPDVMGSVLHFRETLGGIVRERGILAFTLSMVSKFAWAIVLLTALRVCGVPASVLPTSEILAVFAAVFIITIRRFTRRRRRAELLYISMFTTLTGGQYSAEISAAMSPRLPVVPADPARLDPRRRTEAARRRPRVQGRQPRGGRGLAESVNLTWKEDAWTPRERPPPPSTSWMCPAGRAAWPPSAGGSWSRSRSASSGRLRALPLHVTLSICSR